LRRYARKTPQWRTGPDGPKTLCNKCGLLAAKAPAAAGAKVAAAAGAKVEAAAAAAAAPAAGAKVAAAAGAKVAAAKGTMVAPAAGAKVEAAKGTKVAAAKGTMVAAAAGAKVAAVAGAKVAAAAGAKVAAAAGAKVAAAAAAAAAVRVTAEVAKVNALFDKASLPQRRMNCPQQDNDSDCGLFALSFIQRFTTPEMPRQLTAADVDAAITGSPRPDGSAPLPDGFLREEWFVKEETLLQRSRIMLLILLEFLSALPDPAAAGAAAATADVVAARQRQRVAIDRVVVEVRARIASREAAVAAASAA
jgi:hypothetical protein